MMSDIKDIFEFTEIGDDMTGIRITEGKYEGLHWTFGTVQFLDPEEGKEEMECKFDYIIHDNPNKLEENQDMTNFMGDVLVDVLDKELESDSIGMDEVPMPPADMADQLINHKAIADVMREESNVND
tara:strand:- start:261 stop:641 length:381 start_codon:yes stop_codon:yes gene_type:complete